MIETHYLPQVMATQAASPSPQVCASVLALAALAFSPFATAVTLEGRVHFPGRSLPASTVHAHNIESAALHTKTLKRDESSFRFDLPAGKYWVFVQPLESGLTELYGAHTRHSICRHQPTQPIDACADHGLQEVDLTSGRSASVIEVDDWFLDDATAQVLDRILGAAPSADPAELGRPRFSEYRASQVTPMAEVKLVLPAGGKAAGFARELNAAARAGVTFAGVYALARLGCGNDCEQVALIDLTNGTVLFPEQLAQVSTTLPCRAHEVLGYRDDSRLLEVTRREAGSIATDYLLWDAARRSFTSLAQYRRNPERFCGTSPRDEEESAE